MRLSSSLARTFLVGSLVSTVCAPGSALLLSRQLHAASTGDTTSSEVVPAPSVLVQQMSRALKNLNYEGIFVHVQGGHLTSMRILHARGDSGESERLISLDGEAREVIRDNSLVTCIWPQSQSVVISESKPRDLLPQVDEELTNSERYQFVLGEPDRVAGRSTHVVNVIPTDQYRYGYRFWIDEDTNMLLRSMLLDNSNKVVEQVMFTHIEYPEKIDPAKFEIASLGEQSTWLKSRKESKSAALPRILTNQEDRVSFEQLPTGYREVSETYSPIPINQGPVSHVMLSDGMASVSVYVEYLAAAEQNKTLSGISSMGAMNAFGLSLPTAFVTAVGEVPVETVRAIAFAVRLQE